MGKVLILLGKTLKRRKRRKKIPPTPFPALLLQPLKKINVGSKVVSL